MKHWGFTTTTICMVASCLWRTVLTRVLLSFFTISSSAPSLLTLLLPLSSSPSLTLFPTTTASSENLYFPSFSLSLSAYAFGVVIFFLILHLVLLFYFNFKASLLTSLLLLLHSFMPFFINFRNWVSVVLIKMFDLCCFCLRVLVLLLFLFKCLVGFMLVLLYCSSFWNCYSCCWMIY